MQRFIPHIHFSSHKLLLTKTIVVFYCGFSLAQDTFNKRLHFDYFAAVLTSIIPTDTGYIATGIIADTLPPYNTGAVFSKLDLGGDPVMVKTLTDTSKTYEPWFNSLTQLYDGSFMVTAASFDPHENASLLKFGPQGDTIFSRSYRNPQFPGFTRIQPGGGLTHYTNGGFLVPTWANSFSDPFTISNVYVFKVDSLGMVEWDTFYTSAPMRERPTSIVDDGNGNSWIGWTKNNWGIVFEDYTYQMGIVKIDEYGEILWEYTSPDSLGLLDGPNQMVLLEDGSLVIATGIGVEIEVPGPVANRVYFEKHLMKLTPDKEIEWEVTFPDVEPNSSSKLTNVIKLSDDSGFVAAGMEAEDLPGVDTYAVRGWVGKVDPYGQELWSRDYVGISGSNPRHTVYDLKETPDGGVVLVGESRGASSDGLPPQQAWVMKLDQFGCLVPGCHIVDDVGEADFNISQLAVYPNPVSDYLNFQLRSDRGSGDNHFRIVDANGRLVDSFTTTVHDNTTFIVPVWDWPPGTYFLQLIDEKDGKVISEKFIKH